jgi:hypothetical protein
MLVGRDQSPIDLPPFDGLHVKSWSYQLFLLRLPRVAASSSRCDPPSPDELACVVRHIQALCSL